jgi:hypothetical protein
MHARCTERRHPARDQSRCGNRDEDERIGETVGRRYAEQKGGRLTAKGERARQPKDRAERIALFGGGGSTICGQVGCSMQDAPRGHTAAQR